MYQQSPYRPSTSFSVFPPVIKNLLILNGLFFMAQYTPVLGPMLMKYMALYPVAPPETILIAGQSVRVPSEPFYPWQLLTYAFLHGGFTHLFFNMFALWMFGMQVENALGSRRFALFYLICVVGAAVTQLFTLELSNGFQATVGASGGVFGILLAFGMFFPNQMIYLYFMIPVRAKWFVLVFGLLELVYGVSGANSRIAHFAHLGGMVFGLLLILYWRGKLPVKPQQRIYV
jgi:membrane associated rhomboid family serine protease